MRSPALTSWSTPAMVARPLPEVKVRIWSTVCFCPKSAKRATRGHRLRRPPRQATSFSGAKFPHLVANITIHGNGHQNQLAVQTCPQHSPKIARLRWKACCHVGAARYQHTCFRNVKPVSTYKYAISCFGGFSEGFWKVMVVAKWRAVWQGNRVGCLRDTACAAMILIGKPEVLTGLAYLLRWLRKSDAVTPQGVMFTNINVSR